MLLLCIGMPLWQVATLASPLDFSSYIREKEYYSSVFFCFLSCLLEAIQIESCGGGAENDEVDVECFAGRFFTLAVCLKLREAERFMQKKRTPAFMNHAARLQQRGFTLSLYL